MSKKSGGVPVVGRGRRKLLRSEPPAKPGRVWKVEETSILMGGLMRCCIDTIACLDPKHEFEDGEIIDCKWEPIRNYKILLIQGTWRWNESGKTPSTIRRRIHA